MSQLNNAMEIFKLLDKSNCKKCNEPTCLAFAAAVFNGQKQLDECPSLDPDIIERVGRTSKKPIAIEQDRDESVAQLKRKIETIDLSSSAHRLGGVFSNGKLTLKILGKDFSVDSTGNLSSDIHIHPWVTMPILSYIIHSSGTPVAGDWVPLRELKNGPTWYRLFGQRCEKPLKRLADTYTDLFEDLIRIFNGRQVEDHYESDISLVLHPLPKVPILICYWKPDGGLESSLNIFFDATAEDHLNIESIYTLGVGLVRMFEKITLRHGIQ